MKYYVTMKTPNCIDDCFDELRKDDNDNDESYEEREKFDTLVDKFFRYGELVNLEIDTTAGTVTVVANNE